MKKIGIDALMMRTESSAISWAKTDAFRSVLVDNFNEYAKVHATNPNPPGHDRAVSGRRLTAQRIALDCLFWLKPEEMEKLDRELTKIVMDVPDEIRRGGRR